MSILSRIHEARVRRLTTRSLRELSPELLRDIGIEPDGIDQAVTAMIASRAAKQRSQHNGHASAPSFSNDDWPYRWARAA